MLLGMQMPRHKTKRAQFKSMERIGRAARFVKLISHLNQYITAGLTKQTAVEQRNFEDEIIQLTTKEEMGNGVLRSRNTRKYCAAPHPRSAARRGRTSTGAGVRRQGGPVGRGAGRATDARAARRERASGRAGSVGARGSAGRGLAQREGTRSRAGGRAGGGLARSAAGLSRSLVKARGAASKPGLAKRWAYSGRQIAAYPRLENFELWPVDWCTGRLNLMMGCGVTHGARPPLTSEARRAVRLGGRC